jgi:hypothetical protein
MESTTCPPLGGVCPVAFAGEEVLHRAQQKGAEPPAILLHTIESVPGEEPGKEFLRQVARGFFRAAILTNECQHRRIVCLAQFAQRRLRRRRLAPSKQHERPAGFHEPGWMRCRSF